MPESQPRTLEEIKDLLSSMGDIKAGCRAFRPDVCAPCNLVDIDWHRVRETLGLLIVEACQESRRKERERIMRIVKYKEAQLNQEIMN